jgi:hypothetical protein
MIFSALDDAKAHENRHEKPCPQTTVRSSSGWAGDVAGSVLYKPVQYLNKVTFQGIFAGDSEMFVT